MLRIPFQQIKKPLITVLITAVFVVGFGGFLNYVRNRPSIPEAFTEARIAGAKDAVRMSELIADSLKNLAEIEQLDRQWAFTGALLLVNKEQDNFTEKWEVASSLTNQMSAMATALPGIRPTEAQQIALEAVGAQITAASHLSIYNDQLKQLLEVLGKRLATRGQDSSTNLQVGQLIKKMNEQANAINDLNKQFNELFVKFDKLYL